MCIIFQRQEWHEFNGASKGFSMLCKKRMGEEDLVRSLIDYVRY